MISQVFFMINNNEQIQYNSNNNFNIYSDLISKILYYYEILINQLFLEKNYIICI